MKRPLQVLRVEDNPGDARLVDTFLAEAPGFCRVHGAARVTEAAAILRTTPIDVILCDLHLPDSPGEDTVAALVAAAPETPIVVLSGRDGLDLGSLRAGAEDFLSKNALSPELLVRTIRYAHERARRDAELRRILAALPDGIVVVDGQGMVRFANPAAEGLLGSDVVGRPFGYAIDATSPVFEIELPRDGVTRAAEVQVGAIEWRGNPGTLVSIRDISDRRRAEEIERRLWHADRLASLGQLAASLAHEVNNPATVLQGYLTLLQRHHRHLDGALRALADGSDEDRAAVGRLGAALGSRAATVLDPMAAMLEHCMLATQRVAAIVRDHSSFSRVQLEEVALADLNDVVRSACGMMRNEIRHRAELVVELSPLPPIALDRGRMFQLMVNLLLNASQAIEVGRERENRITVATRSAGDEVVLSVSDTGCGMSEATRRRVFEPFFTTKPSGQGTGLGLALAAETVGRHRGRIVVTSAPGGGSCFEVFIPTATGLAPTEPTSGATGKASAGGGYRILIVDDDADVREVLAALFGAPHQVTTACDGKAALTLLERDRRFDAILCDVMMPEMDGVAVLEAIQARWPELVPRLVYITAGALGARARALVAAGGILVLEKPFGRREALAMVAQAAGRSGGDGAGPARESS